MPHRDRIDVLKPAACSSEAVQSFIELVRSAGEVDADLPARVMGAHVLVLLYSGNVLIGTAAIKNPAQSYRSKVFRKTGVNLVPAAYPFELGWIVVHDEHREKGHSRTLVRAAMSQVIGVGVYATTRVSNGGMLHILPDEGFVRVGNSYPSKQNPGESIALLVRDTQ